MADGVGVNSTDFLAETSDTTWIAQGLIKSSIKVWSDVFEADGTQGVGDEITLAILPDGAVVHGGILYFDALGAGVTLSIGDSNDANRYTTAIVCTAAGSAIYDAIDGSGYTIGSNTGDTTVLATIGVGAATGTIRNVIFYTN
jgi:hypothetical protein